MLHLLFILSLKYCSFKILTKRAFSIHNNNKDIDISQLFYGPLSIKTSLWMKSKCFPGLSQSCPSQRLSRICMLAFTTVSCLQDYSGAARLYSKCYYSIYSPRYILYPVFQFHSARRHEGNQAKPLKFKARPLTVQLSTSITSRLICLPHLLVLQKRLPGFVSNPNISPCGFRAVVFRLFV